ncbi:MAG: hypothetical protein RIR70_1724 [Pseudomonadota bacterium]|jgi:uncharacterized ferritin-like protein (DUF455 family)
MNNSIFARAYHGLMCCEVDEKLAATEALHRDWCSGRLVVSPAADALPITVPGRPTAPLLVPATKVPRRRLGNRQGHAALIHSIAHIEFNAINLALDCVYRFRDFPADYYGGWLKVAQEEAMHFSLLRDHLRSLGFEYGDFVAHNGLWEMAVRTAHDPLIRMALVPRVLEARGLDATPAIMSKLRGLGDHPGVAILEIILRDEVGHVALGDHWFRTLCEARGLEPEATFAQLLAAFDAPRIVPPVNVSARLAAGFSQAELARLTAEGVSVRGESH